MAGRTHKDFRAALAKAGKPITSATSTTTIPPIAFP
jgi:hypothetical protein